MRKFDILPKAFRDYAMELTEMQREWEKTQKRTYRPFWLMIADNFEMTGSPVHLSDLTGKMKGIRGMTTSCKGNKLCEKRMKCESLICHECFADNTLARYFFAMLWALWNSFVLNYAILPMEWLPDFKGDKEGRIEPLGDQRSEVQSLNTLYTIEKNPATSFGWWSKNPWFIRDALHLYGDKPSNMWMIYSVAKKNLVVDEETLRRVQRQFPFVDAIFACYEKSWLKENCMDIDHFINCGGRHCQTCENCCYHKVSRVKVVREIVK